MQLTPEIKAQLAEQKKQCIFCKIIAKEMDSKIVFEDDVTMAVLDIYPMLKGHTTFFLKEHYPIMPYIPADEFKHLFGLVPQLASAIKGAMLSTGCNVFIANGGAAGQRAAHFMMHFFPREAEDNVFNFLFKQSYPTPDDQVKMLANNLPIMMRNHFGRNPASWHTGKGNVPSFLTEIYESSSIIYEDEKTLCVIPKKGAAVGHMEIYSKQEEKHIEKLLEDDAAHLFYVASFAATAAFEGLGAHATNIILKSGESDDNPSGKLCVHVLPRSAEDHLQSLLWEPKPPKGNLDSIKDKISGRAWKIKYKEGNQKEAKKVKKESAAILPPVMKIGGGSSGSKNKEGKKRSSSPKEEIENAIKNLHED